MLFGGGNKKASGSEGGNMVAQDRRRLSVGQVDAQEAQQADENYKKKQAAAPAGGKFGLSWKFSLKYCELSFRVLLQITFLSDNYFSI